MRWLFLGLCLGLGFGTLCFRGFRILSHQPRASDMHFGQRAQLLQSTQFEANAESDRHDKILCWIPSQNLSVPKIDRLLHTWANHCDKLLLIVHEDHMDKRGRTDRKLKQIVVARKFDMENSLWNIIHSHWAYVAKTHLNDYDWFVKADDDSFFVAENFRYLVKNKTASEVHYLGHITFHAPSANKLFPFNLGGSYAVSRGALAKVYRTLPESGLTSPYKCRRETSWAEDVLFACWLHHDVNDWLLETNDG